MKRISLLVLPICLLSACYRITTPEGPSIVVEAERSFITTREGTAHETRTVRQSDGSVWWNPMEKISVFYGRGENGGSVFVSHNTEAADKVVFYGSINAGGEGQSFHAVYPWDPNNTSDGTSVTLKVHAAQIGLAGSFADGAFPAMAESSGNELKFFNICSGIKFSLSRGDIKSISFRGNDGEILAGEVTASFGSDGKPVISNVTNGSTEVTLTAPGGGSFLPGEFYYITVIPVELKTGFTASFYADNASGSFSSSKRQNAKRSVFGTINDFDKNVTEWQTDNTETQQAVDLGLPSGAKWASSNLGAFSPEDFGGYFAWGELETKSNYDWTTYKWCDGSSSGLTKYNSSTKYGLVDNLVQLSLDDDAAHRALKGNWHIPNSDDWEELYSNCTWTWCALNGVNGFRVEATNGNSIFLPAAGMFQGESLKNGGTCGFYWSNTSSNQYALYYKFRSSYDSGTCPRPYGLSIRAVYGASTVPVSGITLDHSSISLTKGTSLKINAIVSPDNASDKTIIWSSEDKSIAIVSSSGLVTAMKEGMTTITATTFDGHYSASCIVEVSDQVEYHGISVTGIELDPTSLFMLTGENFHIHETVFPENATNKKVEWTSSDHNIANVTNLGTVYAYNPGTATITATTVDGNCSASCFVTVGKPITTISINTGNIFLIEDQYFQIKFSIYPEDATLRTIIWTSLNPEVATVSDDGLVTAIKHGSATIKAKAEYGTAYALCTVTVAKKVRSISLDKHSLTLNKGAETQLVATVYPEDAFNQNYRWESDDTSVATVSSNGIVKAVGGGKTIIRVITQEGEHSDTCTVTVDDDGLTEYGKLFVAVDLGLSVKWASFNIGALAPEQQGDRFAWGEITSKSIFDWSNYLWADGYYTRLTKYNYDSTYGLVDGKTSLDREDDAAVVLLGGGWRMPTQKDFEELLKLCTYSSSVQSGVAGVVFTGPNGNSIFLPIVNNFWGSTIHGAIYWGSDIYVDPYVPSTKRPFWAVELDVFSDFVEVSSKYRDIGSWIRPVIDFD